MKFLKTACLAALAVCVFGRPAAAQVNIDASGVQLTDQTGVSMPVNAGGLTAEDQTFVTRYDLASSGFANVTQLIIEDLANGGGAVGELSGFDLDGILVSPTSIGSAFGIPGLATINISADINSAAFTGGAFQPPAPVSGLLVGESANDVIDNAFATLDVMDADGLSPFSGGFLSMGEGGKLVVTFSSPIDTSVNRWLYIGGDIGGNGDAAAVSVVPEPGSIALGLMAAGGLLWLRRRRS